MAASPRRWRRRSLLLFLPVFLSPLLAGCVCFSLGPEPELTPWGGVLPAAADEIVKARPGADADGDGLEDALEARVARRHAPRYRFSAHDPNGIDSPQNIDERYFPMSVARFLACMEAGVYEVAGKGLVRASQPGHFGEQRVTGYPSLLVGDPPGEAPVYTHVYPSENPGEVFCEYWVWFGHDRADARVLGRDATLGSHRGDWEHTAFRLSLDPPRVLEGYYYGHGRCYVVSRADLERVDGEHPVVYVSQGKHASFPAACFMDSMPGVAGWFVDHIDWTNGRGARWDSWKSPIVDLGERESPSPAAKAWLGFKGRWGPDRILVLGLEVGGSPTGPAAKTSWGNNGGGTNWADVDVERIGAP